VSTRSTYFKAPRSSLESPHHCIIVHKEKYYCITFFIIDFTTLKMKATYAPAKKALIFLVASTSLMWSAFVEGAGNEEDVLIETPGELSQGAQDRIRYYCTFRNLWTKARHPVKYPGDQARWNGPVLWTHTTQVRTAVCCTCISLEEDEEEKMRLSELQKRKPRISP
jgi:hypothetical protein